MTKQHMFEYLQGMKHVFPYKVAYSVNINVYNRKCSEKARDMILSEDVGEEIWDMYLLPMVRNFTTEKKVYTGGRSGGWLYLDMPVIEDDATYSEVLKAYSLGRKLEKLANDMFKTLEYIAQAYDLVDETYTVEKTRKVLQEVPND